DPRLQLDGFDVEAADSLGQTQTRPHRPFSIVLVRSRVAEIDQHAVAHVLGDKAVEASYYIGDRAVIRSDDLAQILRIEPGGQRSRADEVAKHHRQLAALGTCG